MKKLWKFCFEMFWELTPLVMEICIDEKTEAIGSQVLNFSP